MRARRRGGGGWASVLGGGAAAWCGFALVCAPAVAQAAGGGAALSRAAIAIDNLASQAQTAWVFCALPAAAQPAQAAGWLREGELRRLFVTGTGGIRIRMEAAAPGRHRLEWTDEVAAAPPFAPHPAIDPATLRPHWLLDGVDADAAIDVALVESDAAHQRFCVRARHPAQKWTHELHADVFAGMSTVEFVAFSSWGTTQNDGQHLVRRAPDLRLALGVPFHRDHAARIGLPGEAAARAGGGFELPVHAADGTIVHRCARIETRGALLPRPDPARCEGRRMWGVYLGWQGHWPPYGAVPARPLDWAADQAANLDEYLHPRRVGYWSPRPWVQPRWSETTGEQAGFGASTCGRIVTLGDAWAIDWLLWCTEAYAYRPTCNREPDGSPMLAAAHPLAETLNEAVPPANWSLQDRLGWTLASDLPKVDFAVDWYNDFPTTSEQQHRDAATLVLAYWLTRDPGLRSIAQDHVQLALCDGLLRAGWLQAPRAIGRVLLEWSLLCMAGFDEMRAPIGRMLDLIGRESAFAKWPDAEVFVVGPIEQAVYGWNGRDGKPVIGPQTWQQSIAATQGLYPAFLATGDARARDWALRAARTVVDLGFREVGGQWAHTYAWNWNGGRRPPDAAFTGGTNDAVTMNPACDYWSLACCELLSRCEPATVLGRKAAALLAWRGPPRTWVEAQWRASAPAR